VGYEEEGDGGVGFMSTIMVMSTNGGQCFDNRGGGGGVWYCECINK
jgi:hypothetical protein